MVAALPLIWARVAGRKRGGFFFLVTFVSIKGQRQLPLVHTGDIKTVAVKDNDVVYSKETEWARASADREGITTTFRTLRARM